MQSLRWPAFAVLAIFVAAFAPAAHATDGTTLINQATALHPLPGCAAAETEEFINICQPGSYRLSSNISSATYITINIRSSNVALDLNGFTVSTTNSEGLAIAHFDADRGSVLTADRVTIENGVISGGVDLVFSSGATVRNVTVTSPQEGIGLGTQATVSDSSVIGGAIQNSMGVRMQSGAIRNTVVDGFYWGVRVEPGGRVQIVNCTVQNSSNAGIINSGDGGYAGFGSTVFANNAQDVVSGSGHSMGNNIASDGSTF